LLSLVLMTRMETCSCFKQLRPGSLASFLLIRRQLWGHRENQPIVSTKWCIHHTFLPRTVCNAGRPGTGRASRRFLELRFCWVHVAFSPDARQISKHIGQLLALLTRLLTRAHQSENMSTKVSSSLPELMRGNKGQVKNVQTGVFSPF